MTKTREEILKERRRLKAEYGELFDSISAILFEHDPIGIGFENSADEYEPEVSTILPRLHHCLSPEDVGRVVHEEFVRWFDASTAGPPEHYRDISSKIWQLLQRHKRSSSEAG